jgi:hypothetical protein
VPKTLAEIAIEAGLVTKSTASKAGRMADERKLPLVVVLVRDLGVNEVALVGALRKQTRVPLLDPADVQVDVEALRVLARDVCKRLRVLPLAIALDGATRVLRVAMADPTDTAAVAEIEKLTQCEIDIAVLPLSAIDELLEKGYRQISTAVVHRGTMFVTGKAKVIPISGDGEEISVTAQIPISALQAPTDRDLEAKLGALVSLLVGKGVITEAELADAIAAAGKPVKSDR